jgi:osmotically-inducible protein OsmY
MTMKIKSYLIAVVAAVALIGCTAESKKSPNVSESIRTSLDQAGLKDVSVSQDRDKGVVTLGGHVPSESDRARAEAIAKPYAAGQVVSDQIAVIPPGADSDAKAINSDLDAAIEKNLDAALIQNRMNQDVKYKVKNGVVTLTGEVNSQSRRERVQSVAAGVPNVRQVVNEVEVKNQKATASN